MEDGLNEFDKRLNDVEQCQASLATENATLKDKIMYLENYTRWQNIRIVGIKENTEGPRPTEFIANLLFELFGQDSFSKTLKVDRAQRSLAPKPGKSD